MIKREKAILPYPTDADHSDKDGYFVSLNQDTGKVSIVAGATAAPHGVILDGAEAGDSDSIALSAGGLPGTVEVKLSANPGTVKRGTLLALDAATLGTVKADPATGARVLVAQALEAGTAGELIEAVLLYPQVIAGA